VLLIEWFFEFLKKTQYLMNTLYKIMIFLLGATLG